MNKKISKIKRVLALCLFFLLSINSFAAIVSDNDGSAFVTKAEFDALKTSFAEQIENYNNSIDNKIDGAIASYLAGYKIATTETFRGEYEITNTEDIVYGATPSELGIKKQLWNEVSVSWNILGDGGGAPYGVLPFNGRYSGYYGWAYDEENLKNLVAFMPGFAFDENGVVKAHYGTDNLSQTIATIWTGDNAAGGEATNTAVILIAGFLTSGWDNVKEIDTLYEGVLGHPTGKRFCTQWLNSGKTGVLDSYLPGSDYSIDCIKNNYDKFLVNADVTESRTIHGTNLTTFKSYNSVDERYWGLWRSYWNSALLLLHNNSIIVGKVQKDIDNKVYLFNKCDSVIHAHPEDATKVEAFEDPCPTYDYHENGKKYQLSCPTGTFKSVSHRKACGWTNASATAARRGGYLHYGLFTKKMKLKNDTTVPELQPSEGPDGKFNNLKQFKNGLLPYRDKNGKTVYPKYYGGIPLWNQQVSNPTEGKIGFTISAAKTSASSVSKIRLWVKKYEFPNDNYGEAIWSTTNPESGVTYNEDLVIVTSTTNPTNTLPYIDIPLDTKTQINLVGFENNVPYFLRFAEVDGAGNCSNIGGKITYLSDFSITTVG